MLTLFVEKLRISWVIVIARLVYDIKSAGRVGVLRMIRENLNTTLRAYLMCSPLISIAPASRIERV